MTTNPSGSIALPSESPDVVDHGFLAAAVEHAADAIVVTDIRGIIQYVNPALTAMTGYRSEEAVGQNPRIFKSGCQSNAFYKEMWSTIQSGRVWHGEIVNRRKDGTSYQEETRISPVHGADGTISGFVAVKRDITERKKAEETRALLAAIVENSEDSIIACTPGGTIRAFNHGAERIFGYFASEVIGLHMSIFVPAERSDALETLAQKLLRGESFSQHEGWCVHKDGHEFQVSVTGVPVTNAAGEVVAISNILRDITERKRAEAALRESEERFRSMADSCPSMLWVTNAQGEVEFVNRLYREFSSITMKEAQAGKWRTLLHPEDAPAYLATFDNAVKDQSPFSAEGRVRRADGEWRLVGTRGEPRFSPMGEYLGHIGLRADITERRKAELEREFQHSLIRAIYEGSVDGIFVVDPGHSVASHNKRFLDIWNFSFTGPSGDSLDNLVGMGQHPVVSAALDRVTDPESYAKRIQQHDDDAESADHGEVELKDGRTLEWHSVNLRGGSGQHLGRALFFRDITERKQSEKDLKSKTALLEAQANSTIDGMLVVDTNLRRVLTNQRLSEIYEIPEALLANPDQIPLRKYMISRYRDQQAAFAMVDYLYKHPEETGRSEFELTDGKILDVYSAPVRGALGEYYGRVWSYRDITERKQAEQAVKESEERFRVMADNCPIGIWVTDAQGEIRFVNQRYRDFCGIGLAKQEASEWKSMLHLEDAPRVVEAFDRALGEHTSLHSEHRIRRADGEWRWVETNATPRIAANGNFLGLVGTSQDITERKQAEQSARESEDRFRTMADGCPMPLWITNAQGEIQYVNQAFQQFNGGNFAPVKDNNWQLLLHPDDGAAFLKECHLALEEHRSFVAETRVKRIDGEWRWLAAFVAPRFSPDGEFLGHVGVGADITERKETEQALQESEGRFRELTENIREVFWLKEPGKSE